MRSSRFEDFLLTFAAFHMSLFSKIAGSLHNLAPLRTKERQDFFRSASSSFDIRNFLTLIFAVFSCRTFCVATPLVVTLSPFKLEAHWFVCLFGIRIAGSESSRWTSYSLDDPFPSHPDHA